MTTEVETFGAEDDKKIVPSPRPFLCLIKDIIMREVARIAVRCNGIYISLMSGSF
jgi:hypothetical protein